MNKILLFINSILLVAVVILFCLYFSLKNNINVRQSISPNNTYASAPIAYFNIDSLQIHYTFYQKTIKELLAIEAQKKQQLLEKKKTLIRQMETYQRKEHTMSQTEMENAQRHVTNMQNEYQQLEEKFTQQMQDESLHKLRTVKIKIEDYLIKFNADKKYSFIVAVDGTSGLFYYKNDALNITKELAKGLNQK